MYEEFILGMGIIRQIILYDKNSFVWLVFSSSREMGTGINTA